jgi:hypothetical protein
MRRVCQPSYWKSAPDGLTYPSWSTLQGQEARGLDAPPAIQDDNDGGSLDPSLIEIAGAVFLTFAITDHQGGNQV